MPDSTIDAVAAALNAAADAARQHDRFRTVVVKGHSVVAEARDTPSPVYYRLEAEPDALYVSWNSPDRYLSQSIEADLMWTGDDLDDMIDEELVDLGWSRGRLDKLAHYRNDEMLFTFRSKLPVAPSGLSDADGPDLAKCLAAYDIAFAELGDMSPDDDDD